RIALRGHGAFGGLSVTAGCDSVNRCEATATPSPPAIHFAPEPFIRLLPVDARALPPPPLPRPGEVPVVVSGLSLTGPDAVAFSFVGKAMLPDGGLSLEPDASVTLPLRFRPTSDQQLSYAGQVQLASDDPAALAVSVPLLGELRPNAPPVVCVNLIKVTPADG